MSVTFDSLPAEVKRSSCTHLPQPDLLNVRLTTSELCNIATEFAFQSVSLLADEDAVETFVNISASDVLRKCVRHVTLDTTLEDYDYTANLDFDFPEEFLHALPEIQHFERLSSLLLCFSNFCSTEPNDGSFSFIDAPESEDFRFNMLSRLASALENPEFPVADLKAVSIHNLQNRNDPDQSRRSRFLSLLKRVEVLRLHIIRQYNDASPESDIYEPALYDFLNELPSIWLQPVSSSLTTLSLYQDDYWGWCPKFSGFQFESLKVLALGNFTFAHADHLNWTLGLGNTLHELYLDDCPILYAAMTYGPMGVDGFPTKEVMTRPQYSNAGIIQWTYDKRWSYYLTAFREGLPKLKVFSMGHGDWPRTRHSDEKEKPFIGYTVMESRELLCQYIFFDIGLGPTQWLLEKDDEPPMPDCEDTDHEALKELWKTVDARAKDRRQES
ncbi:hypothetical protein MMC30_001173 [Trapelia coarctata]|nr:hypothetical protein [Trapelia coarctata]